MLGFGGSRRFPPTGVPSPSPALTEHRPQHRRHVLPGMAEGRAPAACLLPLTEESRSEGERTPWVPRTCLLAPRPGRCLVPHRWPRLCR